VELKINDEVRTVLDIQGKVTKIYDKEQTIEILAQNEGIDRKKLVTYIIPACSITEVNGIKLIKEEPKLEAIVDENRCSCM